MSFDEEDHKESGDSKGKLKTFFGFEIGDGIVYAIVIGLAVIFIRQVSVVLAAL
ncbi:MAG: tetrahydromethanopterin S-methyltransferase subunit G [Pseudohongiellaceae bacterium]|jgi:tetrahydromethanopterin S-methyltransferase subunit G